MKGKYYLGKCDGYNNGRKSCEAYITWELKDGNFSMCAEVWNVRKTGIIRGGQCVDAVAAYFPDDKKAARMVEVWRRWHLNDLKAGSPAQMEYLRGHDAELEALRGSVSPKMDHYTAATKILTYAGLNPDPGYLHNGTPYKYGSAWLKEELPPEVVAEIESWSE